VKIYSLQAAACCGVARSSAIVGMPAVRFASGIIPTFVSGTAVFGWWRPHPTLDSGDSGLWDSGGGSGGLCPPEKNFFGGRIWQNKRCPSLRARSIF
jgi:hypothetical protein